MSKIKNSLRILRMAMKEALINCICCIVSVFSLLYCFLTSSRILGLLYCIAFIIHFYIVLAKYSQIVALFKDLNEVIDLNIKRITALSPFKDYSITEEQLTRIKKDLDEARNCSDYQKTVQTLRRLLNQTYNLYNKLNESKSN